MTRAASPVHLQAPEGAAHVSAVETVTTLADLGTLVAQGFASMEHAMAAVLEFLTDHVGLRTGFVNQIDRTTGQLHVLAAREEPGGSGVHAGDTLPLPQSFCATVAATHLQGLAPVLLEDTATHPAAAFHPRIRAYLGVPIVLSSGELFGTLCAADPQAQPLTPIQAALMTVLARLLATQMELEEQLATRRRLEEERAKRAQLEGVLLTARTFQHELNTKLTPTIARAQLLLRDPALPSHLRTRAQAVLEGAQEAARIIAKLIAATEVETTEWEGHGTTIAVTKAAPAPTQPEQ